MEYKKFNFKRELIYEFIKDIKDPEKDCTIEELDLIDDNSIKLKESQSFTTIIIEWKPTTPNCSLAVNIGLCMRYKLEKEIRNFISILNNSGHKFQRNCFKYKIEIILKEGSHNTEAEVNKQLNDKERYSAAIENPHILRYIQNLVED